ncbi:hypothetical protein AVEN_140681-1 [Araneus ventricosus]|uniref:Tc1-like transposase DDE domain-containing protein n=1 Tax=Araneus ventricosus TaxID=182803 RepID=A0A4Y2C4D9_ARAVE|nr:hypothetical protein AVEN_140681-1 [Araneus ventricosus]
MDLSCQMTTVQGSGGEIMVWGMFSWSTMNLLITVDTTLNSTAYPNVVADHVHSLIAILFPYGDGHIQWDTAPYHRALSVTNRFEEHRSEFNLLR